MAEMKTFHGMEVVDAKAREDLAAAVETIPTKTSDLQNDSGYITQVALVIDADGNATIEGAVVLEDGDEVLY